jgi:hypothetical protein
MRIAAVTRDSLIVGTRRLDRAGLADLYWASVAANDREVMCADGASLLASWLCLAYVGPQEYYAAERAIGLGWAVTEIRRIRYSKRVTTCSLRVLRVRSASMAAREGRV